MIFIVDFKILICYHISNQKEWKYGLHTTQKIEIERGVIHEKYQREQITSNYIEGVSFYTSLLLSTARNTIPNIVHAERP